MLRPAALPDGNLLGDRLCAFARCAALCLLLPAGVAAQQPAPSPQPEAPAESEAPAAHGAGQATGGIAGAVRADDSGQPIAGVHVDVAGGSATARTDADGRFALAGVPAGTATLRLRHLGFRPATVAVLVLEGVVGSLDVLLERAPTPLARMVITPGHYGVLGQSVAGQQSLSRDELQAAPQLGEDLFRVVSRLPGVSASDFSAAFRVRGGANDELLVLLDGLELYEPFHLKDFDGALSIVDLGAVGGVDLATGGFGAQYGNRLTGVLDLRTLAAEPGPPQTELALTLTTLRGTSRGGFAGGRGGWLLSARRGFLEHALRLAGERDQHVEPRYYDLLGKLTFQPTPDHGIGLHLLHADDRMRFSGDPVEPELVSYYGSSYAWASWQARFTERLRANTVLSAGRLGWERDGLRSSPLDSTIDLRVDDDRGFTVFGLRQDWTLEQSPRAVLKWGVDVKQLEADYVYFRAQRSLGVDRGELAMQHDTVRATTAPTGSVAGAYVAQRVRLSGTVTAEAGLRFDHHVRRDQQRNRGDRKLSPRLALSYALDRRTTLRGAWGRYWQMQGVHELQVQDGRGAFDPPELAEHRVLGVEHMLPGGVTARAEAYERRLSDLRPRHVAVDNTLALFPEIGPDRQLITPTRGMARGVELFVKRESAAPVSWSASYVLARASDEIDGRTVPRPLDQRHTVRLDGAVRPGPAWQVSAAWLYHSGWPTTTFTVVSDTLRGGVVLSRRRFGARNAHRLAPYHRLDVRITRRFDVGGGRLTAFVDVFNAYDRRNPGASESEATDGLEGAARLSRHFDTLLPRLPSFGVAWEF